MSWWGALVMACFIAAIPALIVVAWIKDRFDEMDRDRP